MYNAWDDLDPTTLLSAPNGPLLSLPDLPQFHFPITGSSELPLPPIPVSLSNPSSLANHDSLPAFSPQPPPITSSHALFPTPPPSLPLPPPIATAAAPPMDDGGEDESVAAGEEVSERKRQRAERKAAEIRSIEAQIDATLLSLGASLKKAMGETVHYPTGAPDDFRLHLPGAGTIGIIAPTSADSAPISVQGIRDPHVHFTYYESKRLFMEMELEHHLHALHRVILPNVNMYRNRLCANCRSWTGAVDYSKAPLSSFQTQCRAHPTTFRFKPRPRPHISTSSSVATAAPAAKPKKPAKRWDSVIVPAVKKDGRPDLELQRKGVFSVISTKPKRKRSKPAPDSKN